MPSGRIPPMVIDQWGKVKKDLIPTIQKMKGPLVTPAFKKELTKKVEALFAQFDSGLRATMKKANDAKNDADAKKALKEVVKVSTDYLAKLKTAQTQWGTNGRSAGDVIEKNLKRIKDSAEATLKSIG